MSTITSPNSHARRRRIAGINEGAINATLLVNAAPESGGLAKVMSYRETKKRKGGGLNEDGSIVPLWLVAFLCSLFLLIGYAQQRYFPMMTSTTTASAKKSTSSSGGSSGARSKLGSSSSGGNIITDSINKRKKATARIAKNSITKRSLLTPEEDAKLEYDTATGQRYHVVFSTDCSPYQHWQSYLVYFSSMKMKQPGHVTRIVSGCSDEEAIAMMEWFNDDISYMSTRFHIQLTPKFSTITNEKGEIVGDYKFFNKPFGLRYWMENSELLQYSNKTKTTASDKKIPFPDSVLNDVVILIDPDMGLIRPIRADFSNPTETIISPFRQKNYNMSHTMKVKPGQPFAQTYGFGTQWQRLDLEKIAGSETPAIKVSQFDGRLYYPVGPPYLATVGDMHNIAVHWSKFVPGVYEQYPHLLAEMFAYCIAAAHLQLPHILIDSLMVSDVDVSNAEGWQFIDEIEPTDKMCDFAYNSPDHTVHALPNVFHMCQRYSIGEDWFFSKRKIPSDIYDCDVPLFQIPPSNLASILYKHPPGGSKGDLSPQMAKRNAFAICFIYGLINDAAQYFKENSCPTSSTKRLDTTRNLAKYARGEQQSS